MFFRELSPEEEKRFRQWARMNYSPFTSINGLWHPVIQEECAKINAERGGRVVEVSEDDEDLIP